MQNKKPRMQGEKEAIQMEEDAHACRMRAPCNNSSRGRKEVRQARAQRGNTDDSASLTLDKSATCSIYVLRAAQTPPPSQLRTMCNPEIRCLFVPAHKKPPTSLLHLGSSRTARSSGRGARALACMTTFLSAPSTVASKRPSGPRPVEMMRIWRENSRDVSVLAPKALTTSPAHITSEDCACTRKIQAKRELMRAGAAVCKELWRGLEPELESTAGVSGHGSVAVFGGTKRQEGVVGREEARRRTQRSRFADEKQRGAEKNSRQEQERLRRSSDEGQRKGVKWVQNHGMGREVV
eukprot:992816-Pleurochrysis_carterae.AAC.1